MLIQVLTLFFVIFVLIKLSNRRARGDIGWYTFLIWFVFWLAVAFVVVLPKTTDYLARFVGLRTATGIDLMVYVSIVVIFYIVYRLLVKIDRLERHITAITRHIALEKKKEEQE